MLDHLLATLTYSTPAYAVAAGCAHSAKPLDTLRRYQVHHEACQGSLDSVSFGLGGIALGTAAACQECTFLHAESMLKGLAVLPA